MRRLWLRLRRRRRLERDLDDEFRFHLAMLEGDQRRFGNLTRLKEASRELWGFPRLETVWQDLRYGLRGLRRTPGFTAAAVLSLALGIGANTAIFSLLDAVLWKQLPVSEPERLVRLGRIPAALFQELRQPNEIFSGVFARDWDGYALSADERTERVLVETVSTNYFSVLGVRPFLGQTFPERLDQAGEPIAVLTYDFWKRRFGGDPALVGRTIHLDGRPFAVIGISPPGFFGIEVGLSPDVRIPGKRYREGSLEAMGRLQPGVSLAQAQAALNVLVQRLPEKRGRNMRVLAGDRGVSRLRGAFEQPLWILAAAVGILLLITCVNVANLLLARAGARRKEMAVRLALGASRLRLARQLLTESALLSLLGGVAGLGCTYWGADLLFSFLPQDQHPIRLDLRPDLRALAFTFAVAALTGLLFGLAPAIRASGPASTGRRFELRKLLVAVQFALCLCLLIGAGLFARTFRNLKTVDAGFRADTVLQLSLKPVHERYSTPQIVGVYAELIRRIEALPGVQSAALASFGPFNRMAGHVQLTAPSGEPLGCWFDTVTPKFFQTLGIPLLRGRDFSPLDREGSPQVAIVNETAARDLFGADDPLGRTIRFLNTEMQIVGVVGNSRHRDLRERPPRTIYVPVEQRLPHMPNLYVRAAGDPRPLLLAVRREFQAVDPSIPVFAVKTFSDQVNESLARERLIATLSGFFGLTALLLAAVGLYGVIAYGVRKRTREIGIRMALGADRRRVLQLVLKETLVLVLIGIGAGMPLALAATRLASSLLFGLHPTDALTISGAILLLAAVALLAGYLPARRAARVNPMEALRYE